jgi:hypothetical protein
MMGKQASCASFYDPAESYYKAVKERGEWRSIVQAYLACISYADSCVGRVLDALEASDYADNTVVIFWSDNGWGLGNRYHWEKWGLWNDTAHVPFIISMPGQKKGVRITKAVSLIDIYPTILELCGVEQRKDLDGRSLVPLIEGRGDGWDDYAVTTYGPDNHAVCTEEWRYIRWSDGSEELYNIKSDAGEHHNLASLAEYDPIKKKLAEKLPKLNRRARVSNASGRVFHPRQGRQVWFLTPQPEIIGEKISIETEIVPKNVNKGVILFHGNNFCGYSIYLKDGKVEFAVKDTVEPLDPDNLKQKVTVISSKSSVSAAPCKIKAVLEKSGKMELWLDGKLEAEGDKGSALSMYPAGIMLSGKPRGFYPVYEPIGNYTLKDNFAGKIKNLTVEFGENQK